MKGAVQMLELLSEFVSNDGVSVEPVLVEPDENLAIPIAITNRGRSPVHLEEGKEIGTLESVATVKDAAIPEVSTGCSNGLFNCNRLTITEHGDRNHRWIQALRPECTPLTLTQRDELVHLLMKYGDVLALEDEDLGTTSITEHVIDTEGHPPINRTMDISLAETESARTGR